MNLEKKLIEVAKLRERNRKTDCITDYMLELLLEDFYRGTILSNKLYVLSFFYIISYNYEYYFL